MGEEFVHNPHDQLFKEAFSHTENAVAFFQSYLPSELQERLDWDSLQLQPGSYTDETLRGCESDLLYTVQIDDTSTLLYCLFEHQSTPDPWMPLRLLRYILAELGSALKNKEKLFLIFIFSSLPSRLSPLGICTPTALRTIPA